MIDGVNSSQRFRNWIRHFTVRRLAMELGTSPTTVRFWRDGRTIPDIRRGYACDLLYLSVTSPRSPYRLDWADLFGSADTVVLQRQRGGGGRQQGR